MALLVKYDLPKPALVLALLAVIAFFTYSLFNLKKHPLSRFPGPTIWACSRLPYVLSLQNGTLHAKLKALHDIYGPVVRVAPNELSFIEPGAWKNIYCDGFGRSDIFYGMLGQNSAMGASPGDHGRMRDALNPAFRPRAIRGYEKNMRLYMHLLVEQLGVVAKNKSSDERFDKVGQEEVPVDIVRWLNFTAFDIVGNIVYGGEPFGCLRRGELHPWVGLIFAWLEAGALFVAVRYYAPLERLLLWLVPRSLTKQKEEFDWLGRERLRKHISVEDEIDGDGVEDKKDYDRASPSNVLFHLKSTKNGAIMTSAEMEANLNLLVIGGSETVATMLSGTINYLCQNAVELKMLTDEVRSAVPHEEGLTLANLSQLPYLTAVIKEGLRITSPLPMSFPRIVPAEGAMIADYWVPGHTIVAVNQFAANRSATHFYKPLAFLPERWLDPKATSSSLPFTSDKHDASRNFGGGAWDCIGQGIAWAEMRLVLANLVWAFDIEAVRAMDWAQQKVYIIWQKKPFEVRLRRRVTQE